MSNPRSSCAAVTDVDLEVEVQTLSPARPQLRLLRGRPLDESSDEELARAAIRGDREAAPALWRRYTSVVRNVLRRTLGVHADIEDDTQEVFMRLFRRVRTLRDPSALRSFVIGIAIRVARKRLTHRWTHRWLLLTSSGVTPRQVSEDDHDARETVRRFCAVLDRMGPESRQVFQLRHLDGLELTEVAARLGVSLATIKRRLAKVDQRLRASMVRDPLLSDWVPQAEEPSASRTGHA